MRRIAVFSITVALSLAIGCSESTTPSANAPGSTQTTSTPGPAVANAAAPTANSMPGFVAKRPKASYTDPRQAVYDFLVSVKTGDHETATALLTTGAQQEAWKNGLAISGDGFPDAQFSISESQLLENQEAHVMTVWQNEREAGVQKSFECVWLLRQEPHGWCIHGMATRLEVEPPQVLELNFENQAEMQQRQQWAQKQMENYAQLQEYRRTAAANAQQAATQGPQASANAPQASGTQQFPNQNPATYQPTQQATLPVQTPR